MTSKGQVTIPKALRQQLGLARGSRLSFQLVDDHIEVRPCRPSPAVGTSGFGLLKTERPPIPVDFDPASLLRCGIGTGMGVAGLLRFSDKAGAAGARSAASSSLPT